MKKLFFDCLIALLIPYSSYAMIANNVAYGQSIQWIKLTRDLGYDVNEPYPINSEIENYRNRTPLQIACLKESQRLVTYLLSLPEIEINKHESNTIPPTHIMIEKNKINDDGCNKILGLLLQHPHRCINLQDPNGNTALHIACKNGNQNIVTLLLCQNAHTHLANKKGRLAIHFATEKNHSDIVNQLLNHNHSLINAPTKWGKTLMHIAAQNKCFQTMQLLLDCPDFEIYTQDIFGNTPLHYCCSENHEEGLILLLNKSKTGINIQNHEGNTALHIAAQKKSLTIPIIEILIKQDAKTILKNHQQRTALAYCYFSNKLSDINPAILQRMINESDKEGNNQFHLYAAAQQKSSKYLNFLRAQRVSFLAKNTHEQTAADIAYKEYKKTYHLYLAKPVPEIKYVLDNQEQVLHSFLRITSTYVDCSLWKEIFILFNVSPDNVAYIMKYYYKINIETIIACRYRKNHQYPHKEICLKNSIKQKLIENPQHPQLLWKK